MKKFVSFALAALMLLSLAACGGGQEAAGSDAPSTPAGSPADPTKEPGIGGFEPAAPEPIPTPDPTPTPEPSKPPVSYELSSVEGFVNGWAYIQFRDTETKTYYNGIIDTQGKLHTYFNTSNISVSYTAGSGRFYGQKDKTYYVIDTKGQVHTYPEVQERYGYNTYFDGYGYVVERKSGFDAVEYVTHIYDPDGTELTSFSGNPGYLYYAGQGIFLFYNSSVQKPSSYYSVDGYDLYFAQSDTWLKEQVLSTSGSTGLNSYRVNDGIFVYRVNAIGSREGDTGEVFYADAQGNTHTITVPEEYGQMPCYLTSTNGIMLFYNYNTTTVYSYNTKTGAWTLYEGSRKDNLYYISNAVAGDGHFALPLRGADGKMYWVLVNEKLEELTEPTLGTARMIQDGVVYVEDNGLRCYDYKGNLLSTFRSHWYTDYNYTYRGIENGIICQTSDDKDNNRPRGYYKVDGTPAFQIDFSTGVEVTELGF